MSRTHSAHMDPPEFTYECRGKEGTSDRQVQSPKPSGSGEKSQAQSGVSRVDSGFSQGSRLQALPGVGNEVVHMACTRRLAAVVLATVALIHPTPAKAHVRGCHSADCDRRVHAKRRLHWKHTHPWTWAWHHLSAHERSWARCISLHESGNRRVARESGHWGSFQWEMATWHAAGGSGDPETVSWTEEAVRAVRWGHRAGSSQWSTSSTCGAA